MTREKRPMQPRFQVLNSPVGFRLILYKSFKNRGVDKTFFADAIGSTASTHCSQKFLSFCRSAFTDQFVTQCTKEMRFSASGIAEYQDVFAAIEEVAFHQHRKLPIHRLLDAIPIKRLERFLPRQLRVGQ